jgi:two-component system sensor histidine kinase NreB
MLDDFGLLETVRWYVRGFSKRTGLRVQVVADEPMGRMPSDLEVTAYRIVQEALTNVSKHAHATSCLVHLRQGPATLMVVIEDDGRGFDPTVRQLRHGFGLVSMRERVAGFGGRFRVEPIRDSGTRLVAEFPLSGSAEVAATSRTAGLARPNPTTREDIGEEASRPAG